MLFLFGIGILIAGYFIYGKFVEKILAPTDRPTPAKTSYDGVDYVELPHWKNMLIQLLNIAGVGPVIGVILGIKFGAIAFLIIPVGNIIGGATHDFIAGMMSLRHNGANLPELLKKGLGVGYYRFFAVFMIFLLLLVVAVFINIPATLIDQLMPDKSIFWYAVVGIFIYYIAATLFPVDQIIGKIYPIFGGLLLFSSLAVLVVLLMSANDDIYLLRETAGFKEHMIKDPIIPVLFVTIACGIISGFHATQSPIIARTMTSEHQALPAFYGMMVLEGVIGMIWAAAGMAIYKLNVDYMSLPPAVVLNKITEHFLGGWVSVLTILGVVVLAITSGDTAMRSLRLSIAEMGKIDQRSFANRMKICIPLIAVVTLLLWWSNSSAKSFSYLWNYFAWSNQVLAASTLLGSMAWLIQEKKNFYIAAVPGAFMVFIVSSYILWTSPEHNGPVGLGLELSTSYLLAAIFSLAAVLWVYWRTKRSLSVTEQTITE